MSRRATGVAGRARGFTLIELMIALLLGMLVVAAAGAIFFSNRQTYVATESLSRVQETARVAFELMSRDLRESGGNPCNRDAWVANVVTGAAGTWWTNWDDGVLGFDNGQAMPGLATGTAVGQRLAGTDAVEVKSAHRGVAVVAHQPAAATFEVQALDDRLAVGDIAMVCDYTQSAVFQVSGITPGANPVVAHDVAGTPGNCTRGLGLPVTCDAGSGTVFPFPRNSTLAKVDAVRWYVGNNGRGGSSLFRQTRRNAATGVAAEEVVPGVTGLELSYLVAGANDYQTATAVPATAWGEVRSVRIVVEITGDAAVGPGREQITRTLAFVTSLRNRNT